MSTVVVHSGTPGPDALQPAGAGAEVIHALPSDATVPDGVRGDQVLKVPHHRDPEFLDDLMRWLDGVLGALQVPELEVARYRLLLELAEAEHRFWLLEHLAQTVGPTHVMMPRRGGVISRTFDRALEARAKGLGMHLGWHEQTGATRSLKSQLSELAWPHVENLRLGLDSARATRPALQTHAVLFAEYFPNSAHVLLPVDRAFAAAGQPAPLWLSLRAQVTEALQKEGLTPRLLEATVGPLDFARASAPPPALLARLETGLPRLGGLGGDGAWERLLRAGSLLLPFTSALVEAHRWSVLAKAALQRLQPSVVVNTSYSGIQGRAFAAAAKSLGIPSVWVQHGSYPDRFVWSFFLHDFKLMWGEFARQSLLKHGHAPESVLAVGAPHYDAFSRAAQKRPWCRPESRRWKIVYMASRSGGMVVSEGAARSTLKAVIQSVGALGNAELLVKAHPGDATRIPEECAEGHAHVTVQRGGSSQELILDSDVVVVTSSTTGFEACVAGRPLIELNVTGLAEAAEYAAAGAAIPVTHASELTPALRRLQNEPEAVASLARQQRALVQGYLSGADGHAAYRVAAFLSSRRTK